MANSIYLDMDGTIADLYAVDGWLAKLRSEDASPYAEASPMGNPSALQAAVEEAQAAGWHVGIISWGAKASNMRYLRKVERAKRVWLSRYLPSIDDVQVLMYGTPKSLAGSGYLFDDEQANRDEWEAAGGVAVPFSGDIVEALTNLIRGGID